MLECVIENENPTHKGWEKTNTSRSSENCPGGADACTGAKPHLPSPQSEHKTKFSLEFATSQVPRRAIKKITMDGADATEMARRHAARTRHPTRAGGQDDGSLHKILPKTIIFHLQK